MDFAAMKPADLRRADPQGRTDRPDHRHVQRLCPGQPCGAAQGAGVGLFCCSASATPKPARCWKWRTQASEPLPNFGKGSDIATDIPRYRVYEHGELTGEYPDVSKFFEERNDLVSFLIGCSFSFESELLEAGIPVRQIEEGVNVPMYNTNIPCTPAGVFSGNMVVSMRPIPYRQVPAQLPLQRACPACTVCRCKSVSRKPSASMIWLTRITAMP